MIELFDVIKHEQPKLPGWCSLEKALTLASIIVANRPAVTVEIGIYGGSSLIPILLANKLTGSPGLVYGIEPWDKTEAMKVQTTAEDVEWWSKQNLNYVRANFLHTVDRLKLNENLRLNEKPSRLVEPPRGVGLLHIDGGHDESAIADVVRFAPHVVMGGFVVMDDINWAGNGVGRAVQRLEQLGFVRLYPLGTGAVFQKIK